MKAIINKVLITICTVMVLAMATSTAFAAEDTSTSLVKELLLNGKAVTTVASVEEASAIRNRVQAYVDAVSVKSETPKVAASIQSHSNTLKLSLVSVTEEFSEEELKDLCSSAGTTVESIDVFIRGKLSYDKEAANSKALSLSSSQLTAKGALSTGKAVCQGYANLFALLAEQTDIQSVKVRGYVDGAYHVMNVVRTADGTYMAVDVTSNDSSNNSWSLISFNAYCEKIHFVPAIAVETAFALKYD